MKIFLKELFEYNHHCNGKLAAVYVAHHEMLSENAIFLFNHILNAHQIWNNRILPMQSSFGVRQIHEIKQLKNIDTSNYEQTLLILESIDLSNSLAYTNSKGEAYNNIIQDILFHIINHSTYHRAQIASSFTQSGIEALSTDYIFYKR
ncbi:MAG TPA: DinB family protein [Chitinophagales bacterium]|nr:DinB family protein [Chitinophagales bacterium]HMW13746.1 DinB family protein [Chitinophagales bacterium]HMX61312.1 DinB family protein [Chitinophagales bacterium]HMZ34827.1 DinB family protein [Chitinophagales bacterium]HNA39515.1 DinB family protein [Chitinophagales bacterium]